MVECTSCCCSGQRPASIDYCTYSRQKHTPTALNSALTAPTHGEAWREAKCRQTGWQKAGITQGGGLAGRLSSRRRVLSAVREERGQRALGPEGKPVSSLPADRQATKKKKKAGMQSRPEQAKRCTHRPAVTQQQPALETLIHTRRRAEAERIVHCYSIPPSLSLPNPPTPWTQLSPVVLELIQAHSKRSAARIVSRSCLPLPTARPACRSLAAFAGSSRSST